MASLPEQSSVLFLCLARDCEPTLPNFFALLNSLDSAGLRTSAIIGENDSRDRTRHLILNDAPRSEWLDTSFMRNISNRLARMAAGREALQAAAKARSPQPDFVVVAEPDAAFTVAPSRDKFVDALQVLAGDDRLFAVGATSTPVYYDLLSLCTDSVSFPTLFDEIERAKKSPLTYYRFHQQKIWRPQKEQTPQSDLLCTSSFNGLCIYRASEYQLGTYRSPDEERTCEHVTMNRAISRVTGKKMLISTRLVLQSPPDHMPVSRARFYWDRLKQLI